MDLSKAIQSRKSVKKFTTEEPNWRDIIECIDFARYTPTTDVMMKQEFEKAKQVIANIDKQL